MLYGMDVGVEKGLIVVGDSKGKMHFVDARSDEEIFHGQLHKKGMKVCAHVEADAFRQPSCNGACFHAQKAVPRIGMIAWWLPHVLAQSNS